MFFNDVIGRFQDVDDVDAFIVATFRLQLNVDLKYFVILRSNLNQTFCALIF